MGQLCPDVTDSSGGLTFVVKGLCLLHLVIITSTQVHFDDSVSIITLTGDSLE